MGGSLVRTNETALSPSSVQNTRTISRAHKQNVYSRIRETKFNRHISHGVAQYRSTKGSASLYSKSELDALEEANVPARLPPRATAYYLDLARRSSALRNLIKARPEETEDLS